MLNWEVDPALVEPLVPRGCELDLHAGKTYLSVVGFLFRDTRVLGIALPGHRNFEEVNLRFYVRRTDGGELRRGVAFIKEIVPRWAIAQVARLCYNEPYVALPMRHEVTGPAAGECSATGRVAYSWRFRRRWNSLHVEYGGERVPLASGSHEEFIAEHYYGYCGQRDGTTVEYQVEHPPWNVWPVSSAKFDADIGCLYGQQFVAVLSHPANSALLADGSAVAVMRPRRIN
jgi:uncharacterized protein YqjF (DUF2071 family)